MSPNITDTLLSFEIVLGNVFHGDGSIFKMFNLDFSGILRIKGRINNDEHKHRYHDEYVNNNDPNSFHRLN